MTSSFNILLSSRKSRVVPLLILIILYGQSFVLAQEKEKSDSVDNIKELLPPGFMDSVSIDSAAVDIQLKSPGWAAMRALALPGWGQFYTGHKIRGSLAAVLETTFFIGALNKYRDRNHLRDKLHQLEREKGEAWPADDPERAALNMRIKNLGLKGGDYVAYGITTLLLSVIDSYISAHLYRFDRNFQVFLGRTIQVSYRF